MNRDKRDESTGEAKARDVAATLDEVTEPLGGTSEMESHAEVGYTEQNVEARVQNVADEEGIAIHRNPDGSHTAIDESRVAEATAGTQPNHTTPATDSPQTSSAAGYDSSASIAPGMGSAVGRTSDEGDTVVSAAGMGNAVAATTGPGSASTHSSSSTHPSAGDAGNGAAGDSASSNLGRAEVVEILRGSDSVMLATALSDGKILAHPMAAQEVTEDADVWFFLALDGDQTKALRTNPEVNINVAEAGNWLSVAGRVEFVDDQSKVDELWSESAKAWFDDRQDPNLGLIKVTTDSAQHWGLPGGTTSGVFQTVKAKVTGNRPAGGSSTTEL